jgi:hypothetical protein
MNGFYFNRKKVDRIYPASSGTGRIYKIFLTVSSHRPDSVPQGTTPRRVGPAARREENGQTLSPPAKEFMIVLFMVLAFFLKDTLTIIIDIDLGITYNTNYQTDRDCH